MKTFTYYTLLLFMAVIVGVCASIGLLIDLVYKILAVTTIIVISLILILGVVLFQYSPKIPKPLKSLYKHGTNWEFNENNFPITHYFIDSLDE